MKQDNRYTQIEDSQIIEKTGKSSRQWYELLDKFGAPTKTGTEVTGHLIEKYGLSKYWSRTLYIRYQWVRGLRTE
ncbi:hypothetical protein KY385_03265 [Candidatus Parcubacteria bacterium]|nr:hypothetical protein [Candidatus Parcubacteria bacterium]